MAYNYEFETTVLGGLPILVKFNMAPAEPDVGFMNDYVDEYEICSTKTGKPLGDWISRRIDQAKEEDKLIAEMFEHVEGVAEQAAYDAAESRADYYNW